MADPRGPMRTPLAPIVAPGCAIEACNRYATTRGWCRLHYQRWRKYGDPQRERPTIADRIASGLQRQDGCLVWTGARTHEGYGVLKVDGRMRRVTRIAWELRFGPIPAGLYVCHSCDNPPCADIDHLLLGTQRANIQDMLAKGRRPKQRAA